MIDIVLMSELASYEFDRLREAIFRLFDARATHDLPPSLRAPPAEWTVPYRALAEEVGLGPDRSAGHRRAAAFLDPVLAGESGLARWDADALKWERR
jgi:hypothetical protein